MKSLKMQLVTLALISAFGVSPAQAQGELTGDTRLACEALLCLAAPTKPTECARAITRYFSISARRFWDTLRLRRNFLSLCPASNQTPEMQAVTAAIANGAGRCDAQSLNATLQVSVPSSDTWYINNVMPDYCTAYTSQYADLAKSVPRYVGTPLRGGYWVEADDYDRALADYNAKNQIP